MESVKLYGLEWMTENVFGNTGTIIGDYGSAVNEKAYYTYSEAVAVAQKFGDGWRLPTIEELEKLYSAPHVWDEESHVLSFGELKLPACGYIEPNSRTRVGNGFCAYYWGTSNRTDKANALCFNDAPMIHVFKNLNPESKFSVRLVRDIK